MDGTTINYSDVRGVASTLDNCRNVMQEKFNEWTAIMNTLTNAENFDGKASAEYAQSFQGIKTKFDSYTHLVQMFADSLRNQASAYEATDAARAKAAQELPH